MRRQRFVGRIAGVGTTSGTRIVVGHWHDTPLGAFSDAMVETADGHRVLLAPRPQVAEFIAATYSFDEVRVEAFTVGVVGAGSGSGARWQVRSPSLALDLAVGGPTLLGRLLAVVPRRLATAPAWCALTDPVARVVLRGVRTRGSAGGGRREYYGATGVRRILSASGTWESADLGALAPVDPPPRFGFSSTPRRASVTDVVTTVLG
ncbi:hypothetical protein GHK92_14020 [Nocardioides sp. dk4132]|uniref:hypothetical protein n=1 Tax=unclassified Nocardioides TaxID=2615069 RepID=UPI001295B8EF|nr:MULTISPECIES: hypothetical protein [unclassified Nocardioides]MQW76994.1 hypothetical protein [Nocardioides sp. dk4132]QGA09408.1 hypothetical protein GFH29_19925 [Nocardioides sp. dk884]